MYQRNFVRNFVAAVYTTGVNSNHTNSNHTQAIPKMYQKFIDMKKLISYNDKKYSVPVVGGNAKT
ncbi:MAG: hypothetical protein Q4C91_19005 [Eubacteriales bacterium]|nr:hypothetical protein [Eubacteriales bacterium]